MPIDLRIQDDFPVTLAAYAQYDVLLVNAIADGMNLVAKEGPILNRHDGVLVLSQYAGAYEELGAFAARRQPLQHRAAGRGAATRRSRCRPQERASRAAMLRRIVEENSVEKWVQAQFADIAAKLAAGALTRSVPAPA